MKKIFSVIVLCLFGLAFADEAVLFDSTAKADVLETGYDWIENAKAVGVSGVYIPGKNLSNPILNENYGLAIRADGVPNGDSNYAIEFITPAFNEPNSGVGIISNAGAIKSMEIVLTLNRGYDDVTIVWYQEGIEHKRKFKACDSETTMESMVEFNVKIDFSEYVSDPRNRSTRQIPVAGLKMTDICLKRIQVTTHQNPGDWTYSPISILGIKKISVVYDKAVTPEAYERGQEADKVFNIEANKKLMEKTKKAIESEIRMNEYNKSLMTEESKE